MPTATYQARRGELLHYFDRTASDAWKKLTSDVPVSGIRATVRAGRKDMRDTLLGWMPADLRGARILDAGCGTGVLALEAARRGADVTAIDISPTLIGFANDTLAAHEGTGVVRFMVGDMLDPSLGRFDYVIAMDSLIHYEGADIARVLAGLAERTDCAIGFTFAPRTLPLVAMHAVGRFFPRSDRAPSIKPVAESKMRTMLEREPGLRPARLGRTKRIMSGFYTSQALEIVCK